MINNKCTYFIGVLFIILTSCVEKKTNSVHLHDIVTKSQYDSIALSLSAKKNEVDSIDLSFLPLSEIKSYNINWDSICYINTRHFLDRFTTTDSKKIKYSFGNKSVSVSEWVFDDSTTTMSVFLNWMNCFGQHCQIVQLYKEENIQSNALLILQNNDKIIEIQTKDALFSELQKWVKIYTDNKQQKWNFIISQRKNGLSKWDKT